MAYQVGKYCYADEASAAFAACGQFAPVTAVLTGGDVRTVSCAGSNGQSLRLAVTTTSVTSGQTQTSEIQQALAFAPCQETDVIQAWETITGALLAGWALCYGLLRICRLLSTNPRGGE